ncbi:uncharacterized protein LAESUDRAFT_529004 [Laetiporus sulphureus 93-53]|uniref:Uncharacterized protein n=1 Tax=Laetiporus sulphureus 93-53 TaxID=1314785 RepID=A0A165BBU8_9APHY|nr:uncharacterized protein LAESUDRAFT_529004 [Laetiporus sulphureus 93-53]KZT00696.1 hypothetical protein LAESUDRAFT_529004 [Laetiporus sulphureus 93-53]
MAASLNAGGYVSTAVISGNDFKDVTSGGESLLPGATFSADVPFIIQPAIHSAPKREHEQWSSVPATKARTLSTGSNVSQSLLKTGTVNRKPLRISPSSALVGGPVSRDHPSIMSSPTASGSDDSKLKISDHLRVATTDSITCQWSHVVPGLPPCTRSCSR